MNFRKGRWRLALGRLVNLRYINRWIIFCADLFISLCVSLIGVLGLLSIMHVYISGISVLKVGIASFVASILSFLTFKVYHGVIRHSTLRGLWRIGGVAITKSILMFILLHLLRADFNSSIYWVGGITDCMLTIVLLITLRVFVINVYNRKNVFTMYTSRSEFSFRDLEIHKMNLYGTLPSVSYQLKF